MHFGIRFRAILRSYSDIFSGIRRYSRANVFYWCGPGKSSIMSVKRGLYHENEKDFFQKSLSQQYWASSPPLAGFGAEPQESLKKRLQEREGAEVDMPWEAITVFWA